MSSMFSISNVLPSPFPTSLGGNTKSYESVGGKSRRRSRRSKKHHKKHRKSVKKNKTKRFFFF